MCHGQPPRRGDYSTAVSGALTLGIFQEWLRQNRVNRDVADISTDTSRSHLELTIKAASIGTRNSDRDAHLRSNDFLAMNEYPEVRFVSTAVEPVGDDRYRVMGDLTLRGVTKPVIADLEYTGAAVDPFGNQRIGFEGSATVNRKDWGLTWNAPLEAGGVLVSEKATLEFEVSAIKSADAAKTVDAA